MSDLPSEIIARIPYHDVLRQDHSRDSHRSGVAHVLGGVEHKLTARGSRRLQAWFTADDNSDTSLSSSYELSHTRLEFLQLDMSRLVTIGGEKISDCQRALGPHDNHKVCQRFLAFLNTMLFFVNILGNLKTCLTILTLSVLLRRQLLHRWTRNVCSKQSMCTLHSLMLALIDSCSWWPDWEKCSVRCLVTATKDKNTAAGMKVQNL